MAHQARGVEIARIGVEKMGQTIGNKNKERITHDILDAVSASADDLCIVVSATFIRRADAGGNLHRKSK